ncbi:MAG: ATP-dependent protease, partial [Dethiobacteria bacterium]
AVTGSVNQKGEIQPVGGITRKIEGFFAACKLQGLTGEQGVLIPAQNVINLMLDAEVVEAVQENKFHLYAIKTIDEGLEILTGTPAGERDTDGAYPAGTINALVEKNLKEYHKLLGKKATEMEQAGELEKNNEQQGDNAPPESS